jgi:23S rRNA (guanosine2251-2'-O)-methyltransferase
VTDAGNLGSIVRSAVFFGISGIVLPKDRSAQPGAAVLRASAGHLARCKLSVVVNLARALDELRDAGFTVIGTAASGEPLTSSLRTGPTVLVLGSEGSGLRPNVARHCDRMAGIAPIGPAESLNVGVFAGVALHALARCSALHCEQWKQGTLVLPDQG